MDELKYKIGIETDRISPEQLIDPDALSSLVALNQQIEEYKRELKELAEVEKQQGELSEKQKRDQEETKLALKDTQVQYNEVKKSIETVDAAVRTSTNTYKGLVAENKALMEAMRNVPFDDTTGELQRLQAQYNANNEKLKDFDATIGNHQRNVGNYSDSLKGMGGQLSSLPGPIGGAVTSVKTFNTVLKANPLLLVVAGVAALIAALSKLQPAVDFISKSFQVLSNTVQFFVDKAAGFLGIIEQSDITLGETIQKTMQLADAEVRLRDAKREQIVALAEQDKLISELRLKAADRNLSEQERIDILKQAEAVERAQLQDKIRLATEELRIAEERAAINHSDAATLEDIANKRAALLRLEEDSNNFLREQIGRRTELEAKVAAEQKRLNDEAHKRRLEQIKKEQDARFEAWYKSEENIRQAEEEASQTDYIDLQLDLEEKTNDLKLALNRQYAQLLNNQLTQMLEEQGNLVMSAEQQRLIRQQELEQMYLDLKLDANTAYLQAKEHADLEYEQKLKDAKERELELEKAVQKTKTDLIIEAINNAIKIGEAFFGKTKALAVAQAIIDTLGAAVSVMRDTKGPLWARLLSAGAITAQGFANVKKILSTKPGGGSASGGGGMAGARPAMSSTAVTPAGSLVSQDFARASIAGQVATDATSRNMADRPVQVMANVDRRGLAIAVREGERSIRTQQFDYK
jgi:hypothetical protein